VEKCPFKGTTFPQGFAQIFAQAGVCSSFTCPTPHLFLSYQQNLASPEGLARYKDSVKQSVSLTISTGVFDYFFSCREAGPVLTPDS